MTRKQVRQAKRAMLAWVESKVGLGYKLGARGHGDPEVYDCRGLAEEMYIAAGVGEAMGGGHTNVRAEVRWAKENGRFRPPEADPQPCWWVIYNEPSAMPGPSDNPDCIRHVAVLVEPPTLDDPFGLCISAFNPKRGVIEHGLQIMGLAVYGYVKPAFSLVGADDVPITDPEPPIVEP